MIPKMFRTHCRLARQMFFVAAMLLAAHVFPAGHHPGCGVERWSIKDLNDPRAKDVHKTPVKKTVADLIQLPSVVPTRDEPRRNDEVHLYRVVCELVRYKLEDDGDVHMVIRDPDDHSAHMIAEIPDPDCPDAKASGHAKEYAAARAALNALVGANPPNSRMQSIQPMPLIEITGVGFYDFPHHQSGKADNNLEIHPVLSLKHVK